MTESKLQEWESSESCSDIVSFNASAAYSDLSSVPRLPQMRRVQKLKRSMLLQYSAQTDSFGDNDWEDSVNEGETQSIASPGNNNAYWGSSVNASITTGIGTQ